MTTQTDLPAGHGLLESRHRGQVPVHPAVHQGRDGSSEGERVVAVEVASSANETHVIDMTQGENRRCGGGGGTGQGRAGQGIIELGLDAQKQRFFFCGQRGPRSRRPQGIVSPSLLPVPLSGRTHVAIPKRRGLEFGRLRLPPRIDCPPCR